MDIEIAMCMNKSFYIMKVSNVIIDFPINSAERVVKIEMEISFGIICVYGNLICV